MIKEEYIKRKQDQSKHFKVSGIEVYIKSQIPNDISVKNVITRVASILPKHLLSNINNIYIGDFEVLNKRKIQAMYKDSSIFATNKQTSEDDLLDDLIHEVAHSVEEINEQLIYSDKKVEKEFLFKRKEMWLVLKNEGFELELSNFLETKYQEEFDMFLYKKVGYPLLSSITSRLFYSPYAATSLREYFANGFEAFFLKEDIDRLKSISPELFKKNTLLLEKNKDHDRDR